MGDEFSTEHSKEEREVMLRKMEQASRTFYGMAVSCGFHQFIEVTGFMNEMIKACRRMHEEGIDFATTSLTLKGHEAAYIAEKFDCIFGDALAESEEAREAFLSSLAAHGGWNT
jgi:hypothetical protein